MKHVETGLPVVHKLRALNGGPKLELHNIVYPTETVLYPIFKPTPPEVDSGKTKYGLGLDKMRHLDQMNCMRVEMNALYILHTTYHMKWKAQENIYSTNC